MHLFAILSIVSAFITLITSVIAWRRSAPGSLLLSLLLLSMTLWSAFYSTQWMDISREAKVFWFHVMYIGVALLPTLFFLFVLAFTHNDTCLTKRNLLLLCVHPTASLLLQWTNNYHHLYYLSLTVVEENQLLVMDIVRGPWYFSNTIYSYALIGVAFLVLSQATLRSSPLYLNQYRLILFGSFLPWVGSIYSEFNYTEWSGLDLAPLMFGLSGIVFVVAIRHTHFMDLIPIARSHLIENMRDGIVVLNVQKRIVDINPAMENFIAGKASAYMGKNAFEVWQPWIESTDLFLDERETCVELKVPLDPSRYLDLCVTPLYDDRDHILNGHLMIFRDVTERKQVEKRLRYVNERLQGQLIEIGLLQSRLREQAIRDSLTNLFNRRYLEETLDRELSRAGRENYPVCIIMIDIDHFKRVNDTYGHEAGDQVLKAIANTLGEQSRRGDFACRYGGEEFVIVMPNISLEIAYERAQNLRQSLTLLRVPHGIYSLSVTISMGIACYPQNGLAREAILRAADQAMYAAKDAGRDHILSYNQLLLSEEVLKD